MRIFHQPYGHCIPNLAQSSTFCPASGCLFCLLLNTWFRNVQSFFVRKANIQVTAGPLTFTQVFWCPTNSMDIPGCQLQARGLTGNSEALGNRGIFEKEKKQNTCLGHLVFARQGMNVCGSSFWMGSQRA